MSASLPIWRSMLFVPAHVEKFVAAAHKRGADAYILDLEDAVPADQKAQARSMLANGAAQVSASGGAALVRINAPAEMLEADLDAAVMPAVHALVLPKVNDAQTVQDIAARIDVLEAQRGMPRGHTLLIAQIEDVRALPQLDAIAASHPRLLGMSLGSEDFSASAGMAPIPEALFAPNQQIVFACRRAGILPFGFPASIADYSDIERFGRTIRLASQLGFVGAFCVHPTQVSVLNREFAPSADDIADAQGTLAAFAAAQAEGRAAATYKNKMVDPPVVARAEEILRRAQGLATSGHGT